MRQNLFSKIFCKYFNNMILGCSRQDSICIGELYLKAWSTYEDDQRLLKVIEEDCIQNFMYHCVLANKKSKIFEPLLGILVPFHSSKNNKRVQKMLQRWDECRSWMNYKYHPLLIFTLILLFCETVATSTSKVIERKLLCILILIFRFNESCHISNL